SHCCPRPSSAPRRAGACLRRTACEWSFSADSTVPERALSYPRVRRELAARLGKERGPARRRWLTSIEPRTAHRTAGRWGREGGLVDRVDRLAAWTVKDATVDSPILKDLDGALRNAHGAGVVLRRPSRCIDNRASRRLVELILGL